MLLVLAVALAVPTRAWANVEDYETALMTPEQLYQYEYVPDIEVRENAPVVRALPDNATTVDYVNDTLDQFNKVQLGSSYQDYLGMLRALLGNSGGGPTLTIMRTVMTTAIGVCFLWWGVRKAVRIVMVSARKGKASL